jgi:hypothetical protein
MKEERINKTFRSWYPCNGNTGIRFDSKEEKRHGLDTVASGYYDKGLLKYGTVA